MYRVPSSTAPFSGPDYLQDTSAGNVLGNTDYIPPSKTLFDESLAKGGVTEDEHPASNDTQRNAGPCEPLAAVMRAIIPHGGVLSGVFNLTSVTLGAGIISIPSAFNISGVVMASIYLVIVTILTIFSVAILMKASLKSGLKSYEELARGLLGARADIAVALLLTLLCLGACVGYVIAVGDILSAIFDHDGIPVFLRGKSGRRCLQSVIWLLFMYPLVLPKHINSLRFVSVVGVFFIIFFVICVVVHSCTHGLKNGLSKDIELIRSGNLGVAGLSIFMFVCLNQVSIFKVAYEKKNPTVKNVTFEASISSCLCSLMYFLAGFFGYADFGLNLNGSILQFYNPYQNPVFFVCFIGLIVKLCAAFSLNMLVCRTALFKVLRWDVDTMPYWKHTICSSIFAIIALILGLFVPNIDTVFGLLGATCGGFISFVFPALFYMYAGNWSLKTVGIWYYLGTYFLLLCGVIAIVFGTGSSIYSVVVGYS